MWWSQIGRSHIGRSPIGRPWPFFYFISSEFSAALARVAYGKRIFKCRCAPEGQLSLAVLILSSARHEHAVLGLARIWEQSYDPLFLPVGSMNARAAGIALFLLLSSTISFAQMSSAQFGRRTPTSAPEMSTLTVTVK